jgi:CubicO group peptidase (beta-lactamase class C family)
MPHDRRQVLEQVANGYINRKEFAGIEWLVQAGGKTLSEGRAGVADPEDGTPLPDVPIYRIYSMTKPIVSVMALILIEQGRLRLFDFLPQFNPAFARMRVLHPSGRIEPAERPITVEDLLTHRAGFTYEFITGCHVAPMYSQAEIAGDGHRSLEDMMELLAQQPLAFQPGSAFRYSVATDVLAHVIERATGEKLGDLLKTHIFEPLGMTETGFTVPASERHRVLPIFGIEDIRDLSPLNPPMKQELHRINVDAMYPMDDPTLSRGGHGLFSTIADYAKFATMLINGKSPNGDRILSRSMHSMMLKNRIPPTQLPLTIGVSTLPGYGWGLGFRLMLDTGQALSLSNVGEFGWAGAATTYFWVDPAEEMIGLFMTQYLGSILPLAENLRTAAYQMLD